MLQFNPSGIRCIIVICTVIYMNKALPAPKQPKLTKRQQEFILALINNGGKITEAAQTAGYSAKSAPIMGYTNLRVSHVMDAYQALLKERLAAGKALALKTYEDVARAGESEHAKIAAANSLWDRADHLEGLGKGTSAGVIINIGVSGDPCATKIVDITPNPPANTGIISPRQSDDVSE